MVQETPLDVLSVDWGFNRRNEGVNVCESWGLWEFWLVAVMVGATGLLWLQNRLITKQRRLLEEMFEGCQTLRASNARLAAKIYEKYEENA